MTTKNRKNTTKRTGAKRELQRAFAKAKLDVLADRLAAELGIDTLEVRNLDRYDFQEVHVGALKRVIQRAFVLGLQVATTEDKDIQKYIDAL